MAGIWERIKPGVNDRCPVHLVKAAISLGVKGSFSDAQIRNAINAQIQTPLDAAAETDLINIRTAAAAGSAANDSLYMHYLDGVLIAVEAGAITSEATFRSELGIS